MGCDVKVHRFPSQPDVGVKAVGVTGRITGKPLVIWKSPRLTSQNRRIRFGRLPLKMWN